MTCLLDIEGEYQLLYTRISRETLVKNSVWGHNGYTRDDGTECAPTFGISQITIPMLKFEDALDGKTTVKGKNTAFMYEKANMLQLSPIVFKEDPQWVTHGLTKAELQSIAYVVPFPEKLPERRMRRRFDIWRKNTNKLRLS